VLETQRKRAILTSLSNDSQQDREPEGEARKLPEPDQDRSLKTASDDFRRVLLSDGAFDGDEDGLEFIGFQLECIAREAERNGYLFEEKIRMRIGGVEHDVLPDLDCGTVLKFTKPGRAAYAVNFDLGTPRMAPALPLDYLERLMLQNKIFGDNLRFVGIAGAANQRRIITRQDLVEGSPASWEEIIRLMVDDLGFTKLRHNHGIGYEDSYAFVGEDVVVFDMRPANVFTTHDGIVVPVDCIPVSLPRGKRAFFDK
jgi:hypothetical protein